MVCPGEVLPFLLQPRVPLIAVTDRPSKSDSFVGPVARELVQRLLFSAPTDPEVKFLK